MVLDRAPFGIRPVSLMVVNENPFDRVGGGGWMVGPWGQQVVRNARIDSRARRAKFPPDDFEGTRLG